MVSILITDSQARDLLLSLDMYILDLEEQKKAALERELKGRAHALGLLIGSYKETYKAVDDKLIKAISREGVR